MKLYKLFSCSRFNYDNKSILSKEYLTNIIEVFYKKSHTVEYYINIRKSLISVDTTYIGLDILDKLRNVVK